MRSRCPNRSVSEFLRSAQSATDSDETCKVVRLTGDVEYAIAGGRVLTHHEVCMTVR